MANSSRPRHASGTYAPRSGAQQYGAANPGTYAPYTSEYSRMNYSGHGGRGRKKKKRTGLKVFVIILIILLVLAGIVGFCGYQLYQSAQHVRSEASGAMSDLRTVKSELVAGNMEGAQQAARSLSSTAAKMSKETDETLWVLAEKIPVYGEDITTVRAFADVLNDVSANALVPLCDQLSGFSLAALVADDGSISVDMITNLVNQMSAVSPVIERGAAKIESRPEPHLSQVKSAIGNAAEQLLSINDAFAFAREFGPYVPDVLGANGARSYLIVAENNVEVRATGGFYGSAGLMTIDNGHFSVGDFSKLAGSAYDQAYQYYGLASTYEPVNIVGFPDPSLKDMGTNPDIPHVASVIYDSCAAEGTPINGVFFMDPVFIQSLVGLAGEFTASDGTTLNGANLATALMHDTYWRFVNDNDSQDAFFTMAANDAMHKILSSLSSMDMKDLLETVMSDSQKRHLSIWFANTDEEAAIVKLGCAGTVSNNPTEPVAGIYFTNESWSKMEWYLRASSQIVSTSDNADGSKTYGITLTLTNTINDADVNAGNWYVTGNGVNAGNHRIMYQAGDMLERVLLCAPSGGSISDVWTDGDIYDSETGEIYGLQTYRYNTHLLPGQTVTFTYNVTTSPEAKGDLEFDMTPLAQDALG